MLYRNVTIFLLIIQISVVQVSLHTIDVRDTKVFEIALDDMNYDEESENEMIQPADLADLKSLAEDEGRYKSLHSHVKHYNERNDEDKKQLPNAFPYFLPHAEERFNLEQENKPFIAGFKYELDELRHRQQTTYKTIYKTSIEAVTRISHASSSKNRKGARDLRELRNYANGTSILADAKRVRLKREETENRYGTTFDDSVDFFQAIRDRNVTISKAETTEHFEKTQITRVQYDAFEYGPETTSESTETDFIASQFLTTRRRFISVDTERPDDEESYDYEKFKAEYEQQLEYNVKSNKILNYTEKEESEDTPRKALKRIMDLKQPENCTKEELTRIGIKAIECLIYDYQHTRDVATVRKVLSRTWLVLRVWLFIYICLAIPCWCQRGWCCCCFRCKFCFPRKRISFARQYYAMNPPGTLVKDLKKTEETIQYETTEYERDAYETLEAAIKNI